VTCCS